MEHIKKIENYYETDEGYTLVKKDDEDNIIVQVKKIWLGCNDSINNYK